MPRVTRFAPSVKSELMTETTTESRGTALEHLVGDLSSWFFMRDFVFLNPTYTSNGQKRYSDTMLTMRIWF